jgi:branched-subunit amino acid aminotransferase/4-amino-4-deoxychorismate lyase
MAISGFGLIETMRVREGRIPLFERHLARLTRSLAELRLPAPSRDLAALVQPFLGMGNAVLRVEVADGVGTVTVREVPSLALPDVITAAEPHVPYPHKTTERDCFADAAREADIAEADDALLLTHEGLVAEGTVWSIGWWRSVEGMEVCTPALDIGILPGVGQARVLELVRGREVRAQRAELDGKSLFLVNAVRGVVPIATLDGVPVPVDPRTADLARRFWPAG